MANYTDQEEVEKLRAWWKSYGNSLVAGIAVGVALLVGQKYWASYQEQQYAAASELYRTMLQQVQQKNIDAARKQQAELIDQYHRTPYAGLGGLVIARYEMEAGNLAAARQALEQALRYADDAATEHAARLNLARVMAAEGKPSEALAVLQRKDVAGFESQYHELRADLLHRLGKLTEARAAYEAALKDLPPGSPYHQVLSMKRDNLAEAATP